MKKGVTGPRDRVFVWPSLSPTLGTNYLRSRIESQICNRVGGVTPRTVDCGLFVPRTELTECGCETPLDLGPPSFFGSCSSILDPQADHLAAIENFE